MHARSHPSCNSCTHDVSCGRPPPYRRERIASFSFPLSRGKEIHETHASSSHHHHCRKHRGHRPGSHGRGAGPRCTGVRRAGPRHPGSRYPRLLRLHTRGGRVPQDRRGQGQPGRRTLRQRRPHPAPHLHRLAVLHGPSRNQPAGCQRLLLQTQEGPKPGRPHPGYQFRRIHSLVDVHPTAARPWLLRIHRELQRPALAVELRLHR